MKKTIILFVIALLVIISAVVWMIQSKSGGNLNEILMFSGIFIVVIFALFMGVQRFRSLRKKEPAEDELSKEIMTKTSSYAFYISIYAWLILMYFSDRLNLDPESLIGTGILAMAFIFFFCWTGIKIFGLKNE